MAPVDFCEDKKIFAKISTPHTHPQSSPAPNEIHKTSEKPQTAAPSSHSFAHTTIPPRRACLQPFSTFFHVLLQQLKHGRFMQTLTEKLLHVLFACTYKLGSSRTMCATHTQAPQALPSWTLLEKRSNTLTQRQAHAGG